MTENSWKCMGEVGILGTLKSSLLPIPLCGLPRDTATAAPTSLTRCLVWEGRSTGVCTWRLPGRKWKPDEWCRRNQEALWVMKIITAMMTAQIGHPLPGCASAAGGSQGQERRSWRKLSFSIPGYCFPDLLWRLKRSTMAVKSGHWLQELGHF